MVDGERTQDSEHPGYLYMGDSYYEEPSEHELLWNTYGTKKEDYERIFESKNLLNEYDISPAVVPSGEMAIKVCGKKDFDLILMDYMMPEMDGIEAMKQIREKYPSYEKVPIIAFTADAVEESREKLFKEGMNDFLAKPVKIEDVEAILKKWLPKELQKK